MQSLKCCLESSLAELSKEEDINLTQSREDANKEALIPGAIKTAPSYL